MKSLRSQIQQGFLDLIGKLKQNRKAKEAILADFIKVEYISHTPTVKWGKPITKV